MKTFILKTREFYDKHRRAILVLEVVVFLTYVGPWLISLKSTFSLLLGVVFLGILSHDLWGEVVALRQRWREKTSK